MDVAGGDVGRVRKGFSKDSLESLRMKLLTLEEVADQLATSRSTARRLLISGIIPSLMLRSGPRKKMLRVRPEALERWILSQERASKNKVQGGENGQRNIDEGV